MIPTKQNLGNGLREVLIQTFLNKKLDGLSGNSLHSWKNSTLIEHMDTLGKLWLSWKKSFFVTKPLNTRYVQLMLNLASKALPEKNCCSAKASTEYLQNIWDEKYRSGKIL